MTVGAFEAKSHFPQILEEVQAGKDYTVTKRGKPVPGRKDYEPRGNCGEAV